MFNEESILDETSRECKYLFIRNYYSIFTLDLKFGFKKMAKKNDFILIEEIGDAFRHAGQNPPEDVVKDMIEKARAIKKPSQGDNNEDGLLRTKYFISMK